MPPKQDALAVNTTRARPRSASPRSGLGSASHRRLTELIPQAFSKNTEERGSERMLGEVLEQLSPVLAPSSGPSSPSRSNTPVLKSRSSEEWDAALGEYRILRTIGEGSFGKVKLGIHRATGAYVAIKVLPNLSVPGASASSKPLSQQERDANTPTETDRILREILILSHLSHPNISRLLQVVAAPDAIFLVLEYESGGELFDYICKQPSGRLQETEARGFFRELLGAIQYCHANGIVHRDLKPENMLLSESGHLKLIDYGFTNVIRPDGLLETFCGSVSYAAPEMIARKKYTGAEADVWSLGVILYVMVCGVMPFDDRHMGRMFTAIMSGKYRAPEGISEECKDVIKKILQVKPADRATLAAIRDHPWTTADGTLPPIHFYAPQTAKGEIGPYQFEQNLDASVMQEMEKLGYEEEDVRDAVDSGEPGSIYACYWLLKQLNAREGTNAKQQQSAGVKGATSQNQIPDGEANRPLQLVIPESHSPTFAMTPTADGALKDGGQRLESAVPNPFTPRTAQAFSLSPAEALFSPPSAAPTTFTTSFQSSLLPRAAKYNYDSHHGGAPSTTSSSLLSRIRQQPHVQPPSRTTQSPSVRASEPRTLLLPIRILTQLRNNPAITIDRRSPTVYTCTVSPTNQKRASVGSPLDAATPELAMDMILGNLVADELAKEDAGRRFDVEIVDEQWLKCREDSGDLDGRGDFEAFLNLLVET
ncbi:kinase-like domain-containing protein [Fimicolochytrium jonesii]|uniref:kinase-like domain-containing protein n=1 Tax=Fimicolochytrium jonesii TaxID=1396493 RepID=UPI0022FE920A|nr:kinase-like domain-containing protein [Fimicolochytrium jonesii]KAI8818090.1 kinase-like domain-containing protein [Fimicolochytrium jonesii]